MIVFAYYLLRSNLSVSHLPAMLLLVIPYAIAHMERFTIGELEKILLTVVFGAIVYLCVNFEMIGFVFVLHILAGGYLIRQNIILQWLY